MDQSDMDALLNGPALAPPPGHTSNLIDPPNHELASYLLNSIAISVATLAIAMRMYTRIFITKKFNLADWSVLVGWALFACFVGLVYRVIQYGPGVHQWDMRLKNLSGFLYWYHIGAVIYGLVICSVKLSILTQYIQIFMPQRSPRSLYWITIVLITINVVSYIIFTFLEIFGCTPMEKAWNPLVTGGHCIDTLALNTAATSVNSGSDLIILVIPHMVIWRLNMAWKHKAAVSVVFGVAILAIASSAIRLSYCVQLQHTDDITYYTWFAGIWALPEIMFGIVVACLPVCRPFLRHVAQSKFYKTISSSLQGLTANRTRTRAGKKPEAYKLSDANEISAWPPKAKTGMTWVEAAYAGGLISSSSNDGLRVDTTIETSVEEGQV